MDKSVQQKALEQLQAVMAAADKLGPQSEPGATSGLSEFHIQLGSSRLRAAIERLSNSSSSYIHDIKRNEQLSLYPRQRFDRYLAVAQALYDDLAAGYTDSLQEIIHADVFSDYLEMADHLLDAGFKDAAAVIGGSTLEGHLRNLCRKHGIEIERQNSQGAAAKKADALNADLAAKGVYNKLDRKSVTAWLDLRNKAAHGNYGAYSKDQVTLFLAGVRNFISKLPA